MRPDEIETILRQTWDDHNLSRTENRALRKLADDWEQQPHLLAETRKLAFELARQASANGQGQEALNWLEAVIKAFTPADTATTALHSEAVFSPGNACLHRVTGLLRASRRRVDICVFTISDDRISREILEAHRRGVGVRILSDNDKANDAGSDVRRLADAGVPVRIDESSAHMHHKFAVFDRQFVVTGSYNWTRSAATANWENLVVLNDPHLIESFEQEFARLWDSLAKL